MVSPEDGAEPMAERYVALHRSGSAKPPRRRARSTEDLPASAEALESRPRAAKVVPGWLLSAAPSLKSRRRQMSTRRRPSLPELPDPSLAWEDLSAVDRRALTEMLVDKIIIERPRARSTKTAGATT
jgi:hypothetical protein